MVGVLITQFYKEFLDQLDLDSKLTDNRVVPTIKKNTSFAYITLNDIN